MLVVMYTDVCMYNTQHAKLDSYPPTCICACTIIMYVHKNFVYTCDYVQYLYMIL